MYTLFCHANTSRGGKDPPSTGASHIECVCVCVCVLCEAAIFRNYVCQQVIATCRDVCMQEIMAHDKVANQAHIYNREQAQDLTAPGMELQRRLLIQRNQGAWLVECKLV